MSSNNNSSTSVANNPRQPSVAKPFAPLLVYPQDLRVNYSGFLAVICSAVGIMFKIRRKMIEIMVNQASSCDLKQLVQKFIPESIGREIEKATTGIFPLQNVFICKVKILKAHKFDLPKLVEVHGDYSEDIGVKIDRPAEETVEAPAGIVGA